MKWPTKEAKSLRLQSGLVALAFLSQVLLGSRSRELEHSKPAWAVEEIEGQPGLFSSFLFKKFKKRVKGITGNRSLV